MNRRCLTWSVYNSLDSTVIDVLDPQFCSLQPGKIDDLRRALLLVVRHCGTCRVIIDLSRVRRYGARFLGMLVEIAREFRRLGRELVICGERNGLVQTCRLDRLFCSLPTIADALIWRPA